jgi:16S rRNA (guanine1516-N2)-methyltransferase
VIISTSYDPDEQLESKAISLALKWQIPYVKRQRYAITQLQATDHDQFVWIVTKQDIKGYRHQAPPLFFHPSLAHIRIQRLLRGERDPLITCAEVTYGDVVLDCTAGLATDATVLSYQVGSIGQVIALESKALLAFMVSEGLQTYRSTLSEVNEAMRRIQLRHANHLEYLCFQSSKSVDIVYFDPMFRQPVIQSQAISSLREIANHDALFEQAIHEAKRVARKCVVVKEQKTSAEFERLGFRDIRKSSSQIAYGVIKL